MADEHALASLLFILTLTLREKEKLLSPCFSKTIYSTSKNVSGAGFEACFKKVCSL